MKKTVSAFTLFAVICTAFCLCSGKTEDPAGVELSQVSLNIVSPMKVTPGNDAVCSFAKDLGPQITDEIVLRPSGDGEDIVIRMHTINQYQFTYPIPEDFRFGSYKFCLRRNKVLRGFGEIEYIAEGSQSEDEITLESNSTVYGFVTCGGAPVEGVVVSDGYEVVKTNDKGMYQMSSKKENAYVFISIPSGYEVISDGVLPVFHHNLTKAAGARERVDFSLVNVGDQTRHTILYLGDMHMADRTKDRTQFRTFTSEINQYVKDHPGDKIYAITLGDMTWDLYWYQNNYCFDQYLADVNSVVKGLQFFHTIGNHDHDMNATGDWDTAKRFKTDLCPNYYSFNIGEIHYIVIDNIQCTNANASQTDGGSRTYNAYVVDDVMNWLRKDLAFVSKSKPVVVTMHAPLFNKDGGNSMKNAKAFADALSGYDATIVTGHTHVIYNTGSTITEHNSGAVCGAWWWAGKYNSTLNLATDGAPAGYRITTVDGKNQTSIFKSTGRDASHQFRTYDRNQAWIDVSSLGLSSDREQILTEELQKYGSFNIPDASNKVLINVWDYDPSWKIEVSENGTMLSVKQEFNSFDPGFMLAYSVPRLVKDKATGLSWHPSYINHMFSVTASSANSTLEIKVTDDEGNVYTETMKRPKAFTIEQYK